MVVIRPKNVKRNILISKNDYGKTISNEDATTTKHKDMANRLSEKNWNLINFRPRHTSRGSLPGKSIRSQRQKDYDGEYWLDIDPDQYY